jgi:transglutaminase-like putative cysteine protease
MVRLELSLELNYEIYGQGSDFIFNIHNAYTAHQTVSHEKLELSQPINPEIYTDPATANRYMRLHAEEGQLKVRYQSTIDINHHFADPAHIAEVSVAKLPAQVLSYIYPSRYCQSDRLHRMAIREFGHLWQGYSRVKAIQDWVQNRVVYTPNTSDSSTSAIDTLIEQVGVCRDYAHLMIALCRAVNIPARFVTGTDYGAYPVWGPPNFHAYVEAYLGDRWYMFDPTGSSIPMGFVRFGVGRDAADVPFATIFGAVNGLPPMIDIQAVVDAEQNLVLPHHCTDAISTSTSTI